MVRAKLAAQEMRVSSTGAQMHAPSRSGTIVAMPRMVPATGALPATTAQMGQPRVHAPRESSLSTVLPARHVHLASIAQMRLQVVVSRAQHLPT